MLSNWLNPECADLLRVIKKGPAVRGAVDQAIDQCSEVFNLRDSIEEARARAEEASDEQQKRIYASRGAFPLIEICGRPTVLQVYKT